MESMFILDSFDTWVDISPTNDVF